MADDSGGRGASTLVVSIVAVLSAAIGAGATLGVAYFTFASKDQELKVHLVGIAIGSCGRTRKRTSSLRAAGRLT